MAKIAYGLYRGKFLNAVSVGFIPVRWENGGQDSAFCRKYVEQELLEVSAVAIPANPNALALGLKSGAVEKADLTDLAELIRDTLDHAAATMPSLSPRDHVPRSGLRNWGTHVVAGSGSHWAGVRGNSASGIPQPLNTRHLLPFLTRLQSILKS